MSPEPIIAKDATIIDITANKKAPTDKKLGLLPSAGGAALPLKSVWVKGKIQDLAAEVIIYQQFRNDTGNAQQLA